MSAGERPSTDLIAEGIDVSLRGVGSPLEESKAIHVKRQHLIGASREMHSCPLYDAATEETFFQPTSSIINDRSALATHPHATTVPVAT
jgi:hypothetical protein